MTLGHRFLPFVGPLGGATEATDTLPFFPHSRSILDQNFLNTEYLSILRVLPPDGQHRESAVRRSNLPTRGSWAADCSAVTSSGPIEQRAGAISKSALASGFWWPSPRRPSSCWCGTKRSDTSWCHKVTGLPSDVHIRILTASRRGILAVQILM